MTEASPLHFRKMNGLGNDFVVFDARMSPIAMDEAKARAIADRKTGIGCDQLIGLEPPRSAGADVFMRILTPDASEAGACGNATRCIAATRMAQTGRPGAVIETIAGLLPATRAADGSVTVDMGPARIGWRDVPLAEPCETLHVAAGAGDHAGRKAVAGRFLAAAEARRCGQCHHHRAGCGAGAFAVGDAFDGAGSILAFQRA